MTIKRQVPEIRIGRANPSTHPMDGCDECGNQECACTCEYCDDCGENIELCICDELYDDEGPYDTLAEKQLDDEIDRYNQRQGR